MKLYIHDGGEVTCKDHASITLMARINTNPTNVVYWTPRGTWWLASEEDHEAYTKLTGLMLTCEHCHTVAVVAS